MFWAERDNLQRVRSLGVRYGQLGIPGGMQLTDAAAAQWKAALASAGLTLVTVFAAYQGEDYADIPAVARTVGFVPPETRAARVERTLAVSDFAALLGVSSIACHIGFVPQDPGHPDYATVREVVRRVCDHAARHGQNFALETGQEPADILLQFFKDVDRLNVRINFDPANMIMYDKGDPVKALHILAPWIRQVHIKDARRTKVPGTWGEEVPVGTGEVDWRGFFSTFKHVVFNVNLAIEREYGNNRVGDIRTARELMERTFS